MKPKVNELKCAASPDICKVIELCPTSAISYIEVEDALLEKEVTCTDGDGCTCGCSCGCESESEDIALSPFGRIVIDYDKCIECGICVEACCGGAIEFVDE